MRHRVEYVHSKKKKRRKEKKGNTSTYATLYFKHRFIEWYPQRCLYFVLIRSINPQINCILYEFDRSTTTSDFIVLFELGIWKDHHCIEYTVCCLIPAAGLTKSKKSSSIQC